MSNLSVDISNKIAIITFQRPEKKNALSPELYEAVTKALNDISVRDDVTMTVLTGAGNFYSSGNDITTLLKSTDFERDVDVSFERVRKFVAAFINHSKILVAVVNGPAIGIAVTTLPLCDIVYCTPDAWFQTPFTRLGLAVEGCSSYTFSKIMGPAKANEMLLFNGKFDAQEAFSRNLVSKVVPRSDLETEVWDKLRLNAQQLSTQSLLTSKKLMRRFDIADLHEANRLECENLARVVKSPEMQETFLRFMTERSKI